MDSTTKPVRNVVKKNVISTDHYIGIINGGLIKVSYVIVFKDDDKYIQEKYNYYKSIYDTKEPIKCEYYPTITPDEHFDKFVEHCNSENVYNDKNIFKLGFGNCKTELMKITNTYASKFPPIVRKRVESDKKKKPTEKKVVEKKPTTKKIDIGENNSDDEKESSNDEKESSNDEKESSDDEKTKPMEVKTRGRKAKVVEIKSDDEKTKPIEIKTRGRKAKVVEIKSDDEKESSSDEKAKPIEIKTKGKKTKVIEDIKIDDEKVKPVEEIKSKGKKVKIDEPKSEDDDEINISSDENEDIVEKKKK
jgi:hypothetical protein